MKRRGPEPELCNFYDCSAALNLNSSGEIRISIETKDLFNHSIESYLVSKDKLVKNSDGALYADADVITFNQ